jgi:hypothetical protein
MIKNVLDKEALTEPRYISIIMVGLATLLGGIVRFAGLWRTAYPLNDGGLFHAMIQALQANHYHLPAVFEYNGLIFPFAYPPLGFYITGLTADLSLQTLTEVMRWLPPLISTLTIPAFHYLARNLTSSKAIALLATFAFALIPRSYDWLIMGGGITRSFGFLFAILMIAFTYRMVTKPRPQDVFLVTILGSLTILTHPEAALQAAYAATLLLIFNCRSLRSLKYVLLTAGMIIMLTSPWWVTMLTQHGLEPYLAAAHSPQNSDTDRVNLLIRLVLLFRFDFADEAYLPMITILGMIGIFFALGKKDWFLPFWLTSTLLLEPRSAPQYMVIPLSLLAAQVLSDIILPAFQNPGSKLISPIFLGIFLAYNLASALTITNRVAGEITLSSSEHQALDWVKVNTPTDSVFLLITGKMPLRDPISEWFPVLAQRVSLATVFGKEWIGEPPFSSRLIEYDELQACRGQKPDCLDDWSAKYGAEYSHIFVTASGNRNPQPTPLQIFLETDNNYIIVYRSSEISIYEKVPLK